MQLEDFRDVDDLLKSFDDTGGSQLVPTSTMPDDVDEIDTLLGDFSGGSGADPVASHVPAIEVPQTRGRSPESRGLERTHPAWVPRAMTGTH